MPPSYEVSTANQYNTMLYGDSLDFDTQKQNLEKMQTLEAIQCLREELSKSRIPIEDVPLVSSSSAYPDVRSVYNILRYKKNLHLNHDIARDIVLFGVNQLTYFFDGSKTAWGRMPNLKGWERTAKMKLNSLKVELSTVVAETFNYYNIGPVGQILFSLVPSALIHMSTRYEQNPDLKINTEESLQNLYELGDPKN